MPGTESTRQRNGRPTDAGALASCAKLGIYSWDSKAPLSRVIHSKSMPGTESTRRRNGRPTDAGAPGGLHRVRSTHGGTPLRPGIYSKSMPGTESTRQRNGRPTDAGAPGALASCAKLGIYSWDSKAPLSRVIHSKSVSETRLRGLRENSVDCRVRAGELLNSRRGF